MREFIRHGVTVFAGLVGANVLTYAFYAAVSRAVGIEDAGLFTSLISAMLLLSLPGFVGATVIAKFVADAVGSGRSGVAVFLGQRIAWVFAGTAAIALGAASIGEPAVAAFFHTHDAAIVVIAAAGFACTFLLAPQRAILQGSGRFAELSISNLVEGLGKAATGIAVLTLGGGLRVALGGYLAAVVAACSYNGVRTATGKQPQALVLSQADRARVRGIILPIAATTAMTFVDVILVRHFLSAREAGFYGAAALVGRAMLTVIAFIPTVLLPKASARVAKGESPARLLAAALVLTSVVIGGILLVIVINPTLVVTAISGRAFASAAPLLLPYGLAMAALSGALVLSNYLIGVDRHGFALPLAGVAVGEAAAIALYHPNVAAVLLVVVVGHTCAFLCSAVDTVMSLRPLRRTRPIRIEA